MNMNAFIKINKILKKLIFISLFLLIISISYSYFAANITGLESSTTITVGGGTMNITFSGGSTVTMSNIYPREAVWGTKSFTVTGNNTTNLTMNYHLNLVIESNTFSFGSLKYKLTSTNTGSNGTVVPSITTMQDIGSGARTILLGNGTFTGPTSGNKIHSYTLDAYYPDSGSDQNYDKGEAFSAHIEILEGTQTTNEFLTDALIGDYGGTDLITEAPAGIIFEAIGSTDNLMYKMEDNYGLSYYLRGAKDYISNNIIFAEYQWKIVRINGNGSVRLIYNGTCPDNSCTINSTGTATQIGTSAFNPYDNDNKYLGYMYSPSGTTASTSRAQAVTNTYSSTIKTTIDSWYSTNISGTDYSDYISDTLFCNNRNIAYGEGYGNLLTDYEIVYQLFNDNPFAQFKCFDQNDRFTVSDTTIGNGDLTFPVGFLAIDEALLAGVNNASTSTYLDTNQVYWAPTPVQTRYIGYIDSTGEMDSSSPTSVFGVRPVINLKPNTKVSGVGTTANPYKVV